MKIKKYEVTLLGDKQTVLINDVPFFSTDTDAWVEFQVMDEGFTIDSANVTLINLDDGSVINENVEAVGKTASYHMRPEIIEHAGSWGMQVIFISNGKDYTDESVRIYVSGHILDGKEPRVEIIQSFNLLMNSLHAMKDAFDVEATELIGDMRVQFQSQIDLFNEGEASRKFVFEGNEFTRTENETVRVAQESLREEAEVIRNEAEEARIEAELFRNETEEVRQETFESNEVTRQQLFEENEGDRVTAENARLIAEQGRQANYTGFDGRIKVLEDERPILENMFPFKTLELSGYSANTGVTITLIQGHKYFTKRTLTVLKGEGNAATGRMTVLNSGVNLIDGGQASWVVTYAGANHTNLILAYGPNVGDVDGNRLSRLDDCIIIDLTETFGAGNEPTKEEMDILIDLMGGWFDGEKVFDEKAQLKWLLKLQQEKANRKQEEFTPIDLLNNWVPENPTLYHVPSYMKDEIGFVHLRGLAIGGTGAVVFQLPIGYRPSKGEYFGGPRTRSTGSVNVLYYIDSSGRFYMYTPNTESGGSIIVNLSGITFKAD